MLLEHHDVMPQLPNNSINAWRDEVELLFYEFEIFQLIILTLNKQVSGRVVMQPPWATA